VNLLRNLRQASIALAIALLATLPTGASPKTVAQRVQSVAPRPTVTITADRTIINKGDSVQLTWATIDATFASIAPEIGEVTAQGSTIVKPIESTTYSITVTGPGGSADASVRISVGTPPLHTPADLSPREVFMHVSPSVFIVEVLDESGSLIATGSGVAVESDQVVTNKHVIEGGATLRIKQGSRTWPAVVTDLDPDHDLCRLTAKGLNAPLVPVRLSSALTVGERVYSIGAPEGLELTISEGLISGLREFKEVHLIQTSAAISHGSSGGGLFDTQGQLVGITTFFLEGGQNLNFALPGDWVKALTARRIPLEEKNKTINSAFEALSYFQLGCQMGDAGEDENAVRAFLEVIRLSPGNSEAWYRLGFSYNALHQYDKAAIAYQKYVELKPGNPVAWYALGFVDEELNQYDNAIFAFKEAIRLKPDYAELWNNLGWVYFELHQYDKASAALKEAVRLKPDYGTAWYSLGICYSAQGDRSKVIRVYEKLKALDRKLADDFFRKIVQPFDSH